jgi:hypothetical protein
MSAAKVDIIDYIDAKIRLVYGHAVEFLDIFTGLGAEGRKFESCLPDQFSYVKQSVEKHTAIGGTGR